MFEIVFTLAAEVEWFDLVRQYGERFEKPFERTLTLLRSNPQMGIEIRVPPLRRVLVSRSQWGIYYGVVGQRIVITTILDLRQDPSAIEQKLRKLLP